MSDTTIPVTYAGGISYSLIFRPSDTGLMVRRSTDENWTTIEDVRAAALDRDPAKVVVEIIGRSQHRLPIYAYMSISDWETVKRLRQ